MASLRNDRWQLLWFSLFFLVAIVGVFLRFWQIDRRPMHHDESCQAVRFGQLLESGNYTYDPSDHHGPTLYYAAIPVARAAGCDSLKSLDERVVRFLPAFAGVLSILLIAGFAGGLGRVSVLASAAFAAVSSSLVYYSNYFIQESMFVLLTFSAILAAWQYMRSGRLFWALFAGVCAGLMHATKETCIIAYVCGACALIDALYCGRLTGCHQAYPKGRLIPGLSLALAGAVTVSVIFFSSFFTNWGGVWDSVRTYWLYFERSSGGTVHDKPFYYYLQLLAAYKGEGGTWWSEAGLLLFASIGIAAVIKGCLPGGRSTRLELFVISFTVLMILAYSFISYKTPWCIMSISFALCLSAGIGFARVRDVMNGRFPRALLYLTTGIILLQSVTQSILATTIYCADTRNPYVYSHTVPDFLKLVKRVKAISGISPNGSGSSVYVVTSEQNAWPLPWYLRKYNQVGYWTETSALPAGVTPEMWIVGPEYEEQLSERLKDGYQLEYYGLRPDVFLALYIRKDLWNEFIKSVASVPPQAERINGN